MTDAGQAVVVKTGRMNRSIRIVTVVGARPQFVKAAVVSRAFDLQNSVEGNPRVAHALIHTGQHHDKDMSQVFFDELKIPKPDQNLGVHGGSHGLQTGRMLKRLEAAFLEAKPDRVIVYGDTNTTLAAALAAVKLHIPIAHIEAGLRSFNRRMPEEINRVLTDRVADRLFCPTETAVGNLRREGITRGVERVGDVMKDCAVSHRAATRGLDGRILGELGLKPKGYLLATVHRAENTDDPDHLGSLFEALGTLSSAHRPVVMPLHPRTRKKLDEFDLVPASSIRMLKPASYTTMLALEENARMILTDSGGVQKEAYMFRVPCLTLRDETEWVETVDAGWNRVVGTEVEGIVAAVKNMEHCPPDAWQPLFGDGRAAERICKSLTTATGA